MSSSGKTLGLVLIGIGLAIGLAVGAWLLAGIADESLRATGALLGLVLLLLFIVAPLVGGGIFILNKGRAEERDLAHVREQRALLDIVKTRGQVQISDIVLELKSTTDKVQRNLHDLVGKGLFSGYVDWNKVLGRSIAVERAPNLPQLRRPARIGWQGIDQVPILRR